MVSRKLSLLIGLKRRRGNFNQGELGALSANQLQEQSNRNMAQGTFPSFGASIPRCFLPFLSRVVLLNVLFVCLFFFQFRATMEGKLPQHNTRVKLPTTSDRLAVYDGE